MEKQNKSRRDFVKQAALAGFGGMILPGIIKAESFFPHNTQFSLPPLPYAYDALEPHIDKLTMEIHHSKHHKGYIDNLNKALVEINAGHVTVEQLCGNISTYSTTIRNNAGGHYNHSLFWSLMTPGGKKIDNTPIDSVIKTTFGSIENFKNKFTDAAMKHFGSGWAWLIVNADKKLQITSTPNQDNPLMNISEAVGTPLLALDVWEHAYYLKHQNKRADYINAWWNVVNWEKVNTIFSTLK